MFKLLRPSAWKDIRHRKTFVWMIIGLLGSNCISLSAWADCAHGRAKQAPYRVRRFSRWLAKGKVEVNELYVPIIQEALASWGKHKLKPFTGGRNLARRIAVPARLLGMKTELLALNLGGVSGKDWQDTPASVKQLLLVFMAEVGELKGRIARLEEENRHLRERLTSNSGNSSLPPSSDGPEVSPQAKKQPSGKTRDKKATQGINANSTRWSAAPWWWSTTLSIAVTAGMNSRAATPSPTAIRWWSCRRSQR